MYFQQRNEMEIKTKDLAQQRAEFISTSYIAIVHVNNQTAVKTNIKIKSKLRE